MAIDLYTAWLEGTLEHGTDDWAIGRERHDAMVALRAFDGLDADAILELGWQRLPRKKTARAAAAREIDPDADEIASSTPSSATTRRPSRMPSRPIATRWCAPAPT